ncbi:NfeD family protein [Sphingomonas sp. RT2P30]|uniref:NfeD family protein n=1 Tax=Parasphingomonas halimpatiens TaxID=3096162 RepID=UPI002FC9184C
MTWSLLTASAGASWLVGALLLAIAELIAPGFFLIFVAAAAAVTGFVLLAFPGMHVITQVVLFALFGAAAVALGRDWYQRIRGVTTRPDLNDRAGKLVGKTVHVCEAIVDGEGRVRVGDGAWTAQGADAPVGTLVRIIGVEGTLLQVEPA